MSRWGPGTERLGARRVRLDQAQALITREHGFHPQGSPGLGPVSGQCQGLSLPSHPSGPLRDSLLHPSTPKDPERGGLRTTQQGWDRVGAGGWVG